MSKISDYTILDILNAAGIDTLKTGNNIVCRCPICHPGEQLNKAAGNHEAQINDVTLYCYSCGKAYTRTDLFNLLDLYDILNVEKYDESKYRRPNRPNFEKEKPTPAPAPITPARAVADDKAVIERLLSAEIPQVLWDKDAESFKNIKLTEWNEQNRLLITAPNHSTITRNSGSIKWKWQGQQPIFNRITDKKLVFLASGVAEWLILDWLSFDYIVLPTDAKKAALFDFRKQLDGKAIIVLPDNDKSGSFDKVIETAKQTTERVHICNFYQDKDFRDYCRRTAKDFENKEQFIDSLLYNVFYELGGNESAEMISESDIFRLIPAVPVPIQPEPAEQEQKLEQTLVNNNDIEFKKQELNEFQQELSELEAKDFDYSLDTKQEWIIDYLLPNNEITILAALGASGKTTLALQIGLYAMLDKNFNNEVVVKNKINNFLIITGEAKFSQVNQTIKELLSGMGNPAIAPGQIKIIASDYALLGTTEFGKVIKTKYFKKIKEQVDKINPDFIVIDSLMSTSEINFSDPTQIMSNYRIVKKLIGERTSLLLHHFNKAAYNKKNTDIDEVFGSVNIKNKLRHVLTLKNNDGIQKLIINKTNLGAKYINKEFTINATLSDNLEYLKGFHINTSSYEPSAYVSYKESKKMGRPRKNNNITDLTDDEDFDNED